MNCCPEPVKDANGKEVILIINNLIAKHRQTHCQSYVKPTGFTNTEPAQVTHIAVA